MTTVKYLQDKTKLESVSKSLFASFYPKDQDILIKIHFGEEHNQNAFVPDDIAPIISALKKMGMRPALIDTPVAYNSPRHTVAGYEKLVRDKGYDKLAPFIISDHFIEVKTKDFTARVCKELTEAKNLLVISHFKGHACCGFGGAIKNFGMGGMMIESKQTIHDGSKPDFHSETCTGCGTCARLCPGEAIKIINGHPEIDFNNCLGCSSCELNCPTKSLTPKLALFDDLLAQGATACINNLPKNSYYLTYVNKIARECDCWDQTWDLLAPDKGFLFSDNPIAIDQAALDLVGADILKTAHHRDPASQIKFAQKYTKYTNDYELENL
jgi:uncharacterized Fe-S center protein